MHWRVFALSYYLTYVCHILLISAAPCMAHWMPSRVHRHSAASDAHATDPPQPRDVVQTHQLHPRRTHAGLGDDGDARRNHAADTVRRIRPTHTRVCPQCPCRDECPKACCVT